MIKSSNEVETVAPSIDSLLIKVGSKHTYQWLVFTLYWMQWLLAGFILLGQNFYFLRTDFLCDNKS